MVDDVEDKGCFMEKWSGWWRGSENRTNEGYRFRTGLGSKEDGLVVELSVPLLIVAKNGLPVAFKPANDLFSEGSLPTISSLEQEAQLVPVFSSNRMSLSSFPSTLLLFIQAGRKRRSWRN